MGISTKGRYGVRFMIDLALHPDGGAVALKDVARRQGISEKYLWQVLAPLKTAGLILATRGARGGYALARSPSKITLREIVTTIEGDDLLVSGDESAAIGALWRELEDRLLKAMEAVSLRDLAERQRATDEAVSPSYAI
jgi:Rrf2 family protein